MRRPRPNDPLGDDFFRELDYKDDNCGGRFPTDEEDSARGIRADSDNAFAWEDDDTETMDHLCDKLFGELGADETDDGRAAISLSATRSRVGSSSRLHATVCRSVTTAAPLAATTRRRTRLKPQSRVMPQSKPSDQRCYSPLSRVATAVVVALLLAFGFCLYQGISGQHQTTGRIDGFHAGLVVPADRLHGQNDLSLGETVDPATWRLLRVRAPKTDGSHADGELLRPLTWLREQLDLTREERGEPELRFSEHNLVGQRIDLAVPECGIDGLAEILSVQPCPRIPSVADGRVVTGVWRHASAKVLDLRITGLADSIGTPVNHPFWSEDRQEFVRADELKPGERLWTIGGASAYVESSTPRPGLHAVFNLEVQVDHVYFVDARGVLVHNGNVSSTFIGDVGEYVVAGILEKYKGLTFLGSLKYSGNKGIDLAFKNGLGEYVFFEVKVNRSPLSEAQKDFRRFITSRLALATSSRDPAVQSLAQAISRDIEKGATFKGYVARVTWNLPKGPHIRWCPWP